MIDWKKFDNAVEASVLYRDSFGKTVAQRVVKRPTQKTVADAVKQEKHWRHDRLPFLAWNSITNKFVYGSSAKCAPHEQYVCTREQFEAYVKEQEGEKWTHVDTDGEPCKILIDEPDTLGRVLILRRNGWYVPIDRANLKPIKPAISEDVVSKLRAYANWTAGQESGYVSELIEEFISTHEII